MSELSPHQQADIRDMRQRIAELERTLDECLADKLEWNRRYAELEAENARLKGALAELHNTRPMIERDEYKAKFEAMKADWVVLMGERDEARRVAIEWTQEDLPLPEDAVIHAAHPNRTGAHERYQEALRLVGAKRSKYALVDLVNWMLSERDEARAEAASWKAKREDSERYVESYRKAMLEARAACAAKDKALQTVEWDGRNNCPGCNWNKRYNGGHASHCCVKLALSPTAGSELLARLNSNECRVEEQNTEIFNLKARLEKAEAEVKTTKACLFQMQNANIELVAQLEARRTCKAEGCNRVLAPFCAEHRNDMVPRQQHEDSQAQLEAMRAALLQAHRDFEHLEGGGTAQWARDSIARLSSAFESSAPRLYRNACIEECIATVMGGRFLHDEAPTAQFAREVSAALAALKDPVGLFESAKRIASTSGVLVGAMPKDPEDGT